MADPIRVLELRSVRGTGGGPEKTILLGAERADRTQFAITVCYIRDARDTEFGIDVRAADLGVDYLEIVERSSFDPRLWPALRRVVRERRIDIVHAHEYKSDFLALLLARAEGTVSLATVHGWTGHSRRERWLYYAADKRLLRSFPLSLAVSSQIRSELVSHGAAPDRVRVVLNGIDHRLFRRQPSRRPAIRAELGVPPDQIIVGAIGRLEPQKRFDLLIEACARLRQHWPALRLVIAGDGSLRGELQALAAKLMPDGHCRFLGHRIDVERLHHAFDVFVQSSDYEGTPNAVLEAMAFETPVVATAAGGTAELIEHDVHGLVVSCGDANALCDAIEHTLRDRDRTAERAAKARHRVETVLSFEARLATVENVYRELMANARRGLAARASERFA